MPQPTTAAITLPTPFGPAAYTVHLTDQGEVTSVDSAAARLPEMVFQLTYGERWEAARAHFQDLANLLPFQAEAAVMLADPPAEFKLLRRAFRNIELAETNAPHRQRAELWRANPAFTPALFCQKKMARALSAIRTSLSKTDNPTPYRVLEPWLFALLPLVAEVAEREALYHILALMRTAATRDFLFGELERPGRHIYASSLLRSLLHFQAESDLERLLELYPWLRDESGLMADYMALIGHFPDPRVHELLTIILDAFPHLASDVLRGLKQAKHPAPYAIIRARFERETDGRLVDQLAELTNAAPDPDLRVSLTEMNAKMATPTFIDGPPVTWPQSLGTNWNSLVARASAEDVLNEVSQYFPRPEPRLQRNALLQLQGWAKAQKFPPALPPEIEARLRELISARFDKIFTVALDIAAVVMPSLARPDLMVDALLEHSLVSRYRLMNAAALKKAAEQPELRERQIDFFERAINTAKNADELDSIVRIIPYVNFLGVRDELGKLVTRRRSGMA